RRSFPMPSNRCDGDARSSGNSLPRQRRPAHSPRMSRSRPEDGAEVREILGCVHATRFPRVGDLDDLYGESLTPSQVREEWQEIDLARAGAERFWLRQITLPRGIQPFGRDCERADIRKPARRTLIALARLRHAYQRSGVQLVVDVWRLPVDQRERHRWRPRAALLRRGARQRLPGDAKLV